MGRGTLEGAQNFHLSRNSATRENMQIKIIQANNTSNINSTADLGYKQNQHSPTANWTSKQQ